jgi:hypothetical protein
MDDEKHYKSVLIYKPEGTRRILDHMRLENSTYKIGNAGLVEYVGNNYFRADLVIYGHLAYDYGTYFPIAKFANVDDVIDTIVLVSKHHDLYTQCLADKPEIAPIEDFLEIDASACGCGAFHTSFPQFHSEGCKLYTPDQFFKKKVDF